MLNTLGELDVELDDEVSAGSVRLDLQLSCGVDDNVSG